MFLTLALCIGQPLAVENKCPACPECPVLTVTNKCPAAVKTAPVRAGYPIRGNWWTHPGEVHAHLMSGEHRGKWTAEWVRSLTNSEAESLHSDDHEKRVRCEYVPSTTKVPSKTPVNTPIYTPKYTGYSPAYCPPGSSH
jgi:hypothetical protein